MSCLDQKDAQNVLSYAKHLYTTFSRSHMKHRFNKIILASKKRLYYQKLQQL